MLEYWNFSITTEVHQNFEASESSSVNFDLFRSSYIFKKEERNKSKFPELDSEASKF